MDELNLLLTGDYWHADFASLIAKASMPIMLRPLDSILASTDSGRHFHLVVIAQSRREQFDAKTLELLVARFVNVPVVSMAGSWCEGATRSGSPVPGLIRVYWHQWQGRMDNFIQQLSENQTATWQLPKIASSADRVLHESMIETNHGAFESDIGISSLTEEGFLMIQDAVGSKTQPAVWIEELDSNDTKKTKFSVICMEANSLTDFVQQRIRDVQKHFPRTPIVLILNFPRRSEFEIAEKLGVAEIVSKPFQLSDLRFAVQRTGLSKAA